MANRQYGIPPGWDQTMSQSQPQPRRFSYQSEDFGRQPQYQQPAQPQVTRSPPRKPVPSYEFDDFHSPPPAPPAHSRIPHSPMRNSYQHPSTPGRDSRRPLVGGGVLESPGSFAYLQPHEDDSHVFRDIDNLYGGRIVPPSPSPEPPNYPPSPYSPRRPLHRPTNSQSSIAPLRAHAAAMPMNNAPSFQRNGPGPEVTGLGYGYDQHMQQGRTSRLEGYDNFVDPHSIADDGDDGFEPVSTSRRGVFAAGITGAGTGPSRSGPGIFKAFGSRDSSGNYGKVAGGGDPEKSEWLQRQTGGNHRRKYIFGALGLFIVLAIVGGVVGGVIATAPSSDKSGSKSTPSSPSGAYTLHSSEVQAVMNNKNLHKVFPGMDYTPLNAQYPACLTVPPNQDNITLDVAVLSQLTPSIRLYGTDCNQTQMVLTAIDRLEMNDTIKVWLGVWLENNATTNTRQLDQMYDILDQYPSSQFAGVIVGNEVLFRQDMTAAQLAEQLVTVKKNLAAKSITLPISTSDIGSAWDATIAAASDIVMGNVHPFFAGVKPNVAASWTWSFWQNNDVALAGAPYESYPKSLISETGWPSQGGNDCGTGAKCPTPTEGSIAGIPEMNEFMDTWVCQALGNGTTYFWFEAFDEPWTTIFDDPTTGDYWEPHWGLMDVNRNIKEGLTIPDCGGQTVTKFW